jgi:pimeloyl-ACP methyl ester carboxylesterase
MARLIPGSKLVGIPNSGHMTPLENPDAVTDALRDWLLDRTQ